MVIFLRLVLLFGLLLAGFFFVRYVWTGQVGYRAYGLLALKWTLGIALAFFGILAFEQLV